MTENSNTTPTLDAPEVRRTDDRYEIHVDDTGNAAGFTMYLDHTAEDGTIERTFPHTVVKDEYGGHGLASILVKQALEATIADGARIVPVCPYVKSWLDRHEGYAEHVVKPTPEHLQLLSAGR